METGYETLITILSRELIVRGRQVPIAIVYIGLTPCYKSLIYAKKRFIIGDTIKKKKSIRVISYAISEVLYALKGVIRKCVFNNVQTFSFLNYPTTVPPDEAIVLDIHN